MGGVISAYAVTGSYSVQDNCTGGMTLSVNSQPPGSLTFQIVNGGQGAIFAFSMPTGVAVGRAYRQTESGGSNQCGTGSLSGSYGYVLSGVSFTSGSGLYYSQAGRATADGRGNLSVTSMTNVSGSTSTTTGQGPYTMASDCSGMASVKNQIGTANYFIAVVQDGQAALFMASDAGYVVAGVGEPSFATPQILVVNAASFDSGALAPGAIFSIFGRDLPSTPTSGQVLVNGQVAPMFFANGSQINAQLPYELPIDTVASLNVTSGGSLGNTVSINVRQAGPGIFTYSGNRAVVQNPDYSINSASNPARVGDVVVAYLTGAGVVSPSVPTGAIAPVAPLSSVSAAYSISIGGSKAEVSYFGLTPGFVGLYQANIKIPALPPGNYPIVATLAGVSSNGPVISVTR